MAGVGPPRDTLRVRAGLIWAAVNPRIFGSVLFNLFSAPVMDFLVDSFSRTQIVVALFSYGREP